MLRKEADDLNLRNPAAELLPDELVLGWMTRVVALSQMAVTTR